MLQNIIDFIVITFFPVIAATIISLFAWGVKEGMEYLTNMEVHWATAYFVSIMFITHISGGYIDSVEVEVPEVVE